jgi:Ca2+-binding EF-hand superfamily protein
VCRVRAARKEVSTFGHAIRFRLLTCWIIVFIFCTFAVIANANDRATASDSESGQHDMLLMLPDGPVHVRVRIVDGGHPLKNTRDMYLQRLVASLDVDQDGKVSRQETAKHPLFAGGRRFIGNSFLSNLRSRKPFSENEIEMAVNRAAGQLVSYRQNNAFADQDLSVFRVLDSDESGLIERVEMRLAPARIADRDSDFDQCVTFDEFLTDANAANANPLAVASVFDDEPPGAVHSELLRDATEPILAARLVRRYDDDRDAHVTAKELGWSPSRIADLDRDGDSLLSMQELSSIANATPDVSLEVDLAKDASRAMRLMGEPSPVIQEARGDLVRMKRGALALSIGYRHRDPMMEATQNAEAAFNGIDVDANGYLDRDEIAEHQRFERYLFDAMDKDEDDRVFAEEMLDYVKDYTEPASTCCQVTLLDTGNGFFQMLDQNSDGRVSIRELRSCEQHLIQAAGDEPAINPSRLTKSYRIEIQRGGSSLFSRVDRPSIDTPAALLKPPSGPIWFQRMDRNGDGDLTWDEFLGPRDVFHELDRDGDDLIDQSEAEKASKETT